MAQRERRARPPTPTVVPARLVAGCSATAVRVVRVTSPLAWVWPAVTAEPAGRPVCGGLAVTAGAGGAGGGGAQGGTAGPAVAVVWTPLAATAGPAGPTGTSAAGTVGSAGTAGPAGPTRA